MTHWSCRTHVVAPASSLRLLGSYGRRKLCRDGSGTCTEMGVAASEQLSYVNIEVGVHGEIMSWQVPAPWRVVAVG